MAITGNDLLSELKERKKKKKEESQGSTEGVTGEQLLKEYETHKRYKSTDTSGVDEKYLNTFMSDANNFFSGVGDYNVSYTDASSRLQDLGSRYDTIQAYLYQNKGKLDEKSYISLSSAFDDFTKKYNGAAEFYGKFENEDSYNAWKSRKELLSGVDSDPEFDSKSSTGWSKYLSDKEAWTHEALSGKEGETFWEKLGRWYGSGGVVDTTLPMSTTTQVQHAMRDEAATDRATGRPAFEPRNDWTDEQKAIYGYLYETDRAAAEEYAKYATEDNELEAIKRIQENATSSLGAGILNTAGAIATAPMGMADFLNDLVKQDFSDDGTISPFEYSQAVTEGISTHLNEKGGTLDEDIPIIGGKGWGDVYGLGTSIAQSMASAYTLGPGGTLVSYFGQGAAAGADEAKKRGAEDWQATLYGMAVGVFEGVAESLGIDNLFKLGGTTTLKGVITNILKQAGAEGMEEGLTSLFSNIADNAIMGDKSTFYALVEQYMASGMSESEAKTKAWLDSVEGIAYDTIAGAASGGVSGGIHTTTQSVIDNAQANKLYGNSAMELTQEALELDQDNKFAQKMYDRLDSGKTLSGAQLNRLAQHNQDILVGNDVTAIQSATEERLKSLGETGDVTAIAKALTKWVQGQELSKSEKKAISNSKFGKRVANELNPENIRSGGYSSAWAEKIGTDKIHPAEYGKALSAEENVANVTENASAHDIAVQAILGGAESIPETDKVEENVEVKEIASVKDGEVMVRLDGGEVVNAREANLSTETEGLLYEAVAQMSADPEIRMDAVTANDFVKGYDPKAGVSVGEYIHGFKDAFLYGAYGFAESELDRGVFTSRLSEIQRRTAHGHGKMVGQERAAEKQAKIDSTVAEKTAKNATSGGKKGKVYRDFASAKTLNARQKQSLKALEVVAESLGVDIHVFESAVGKDGKRVGANGWFDPADNSIHIDLYAGASGESTMLFTAAHELTHFIREWSPAKFKTFADFLLEQYGEKGVSVEQLVQRQIEKAKRNGRDIDFDTAYEEVVADSCEAMLTDSNAMEKIALLKAQDKSLWSKIKSFIQDLMAKINKVYQGLNPDSLEANYVREMQEAAEKLYEMWTEALVDAGTSYQAAVAEVVKSDAKAISADEIVTDGAVVTDGNGGKYSIRSMKADIAEGQMFEDLKTYCGWSQAQVDKLKAQLEDLVAYMTPFRDILDMNETYGREGRRYSPYKPNSDPLYTISMDFSTLCSKRLLTQYVIENLQLRENRPMSAEEQMAIRDMLKEYRKVEKGLQVACVMCYVEAARLKAPNQINKWLGDPATAMRNYFADKNPEFSAYIKKSQEDFKESRGYARDAVKKDMSAKDVTALNKIRPKVRAEYKPSAEEMAIIDTAKSLPNGTYLTAANLANLSEEHPEIYKAYTAFIRTATRSKSLETDEPYYYGDSRRDNGNGIIVSDSFIESVNRENGMRFSSWSDWRIQHLLDFISAVIDNSVRGAAMHGYTKYADEVRVLGKTGMMFNLSGVAGTQTGLNEDGSLNFSDTESIDIDEAIALREEFPETAGLQCIGVSKEHILALLRSDSIDYVIPYHTSGLNATLRRMGDIYGWDDFTQTQHATPDSSIKKENAQDPENWHKEPIFSEFFVGYDTGLSGIEAMRQSADNYIRMCRERGLTPKFQEFSKEPNYWKLLIDRKMVNQKTNTLIQQKPVTPDFDFDVIKGIVDKYVQNYDSGLESRAFNYIVENWDSVPGRIRDLKKQGTTKSKTTKKAIDKLANETLAAQPKPDGSEATHVVKYSERNASDEKLFNPEGMSLDEQLDDILHSAESFDGRYLYIGRFTKAFIDMVKQYVSINDLPIAMNYRDAYLSMESKDNGKYKGDGINYHDLGKEGLKSAIESFDSPEQVLLSKKDGKVELILKSVDKKGNKLLSVVELNTNARNAKKYIEAHIVTSIYGKRSIDRYVSKAEQEGRLIYNKKEESTQGNSQVQYEGIINANSSKPSIAQESDSVKRKFSDRETGSAEDFVAHMRNIVQNRGTWYRTDVQEYVAEHPELNFIERIYAKDKAAKSDLEAFLAKVDNVRTLDDLSWYMSHAYADKAPRWGSNGKMVYPYRGAVTTFKNAIKRRVNEIMTAKVNGTNIGAKNGDVTLEEVKDVFNRLNHNEEIGKFAEKVFATAETLGVNVRFVNQTFAKGVAGDNVGDMIEYKTSYFNDTAVPDQRKASTILHELIHACTVYVMHYNTTSGDVRYGSSKTANYEKIANAATRLNRIYGEIKNDPAFKGQYGITNAEEMVAELGNERFIGLLKEKNLWDRIVDWICELFGFSRGTSAYDNAMQCLDYILDNPEISEYKQWAAYQRRAARRDGYDVFGRTVDANGIKYSDRESYAPTFYSHMGKVVDGIKSEKVGATGVVPYLKGKGVKAEEIKWSGIEAWLEGKKSVTKAALQEFVAGSQLQIVEELGEGSAKITLERSPYGDDSWDVLKGGEVVDTYSWSEESGLYESDMTGGGFATKDRLLEYFQEEYGSGNTRWEKYKIDGGTHYRELVFRLPDSSYNNQAMRVHWGEDAEGVLVHARMQDMTTKDGKKMLFIEELQSDWHNEGLESGYVEDSDFARIDKLKEKADDAFYDVEDYSMEMTGSAGEWDTIEKTPKGAKLLKAYREAKATYDQAMDESLKKIPDAPFRNNYHEFVLKRLVRMAAEEGYDSIGWTPSEIQSERWSDEFEKAYRIEYDQDMPSFMRKYGKKWGATVEKTMLDQGMRPRDEELSREHLAYWQDELAHDDGESADFIQSQIDRIQNHLEKTGETVWSMDIPDSMKESVLYEGQVLYSDRVIDPETLDFLNKQKPLRVYRAMQVIDGELYPPMAAKVKSDNGKKTLVTPSKIGAWEQAVERPDLIRNGNKFELDKANGSSIEAAYNPYFHTSASPLNDQFSSAYKRPNLVIVEGEIPMSELTSGYRAEFAKDTVGETKWHSGVVASKLKGEKARKVYLSRWFKPVRIVPDAEVASIVAGILEGENIDIPYNVVTPSLRSELEKLGVPIKYQDRDPDSVSTRSLLAGALDSVAQNDIERAKLAQYKQKIELIQSEERELHEIREQIKELSFAKGPKDTARIRSLQNDATRIANRINTYDRQLLTLEASAPLKAVLEREKAMAYKKAEKKGKEALARYKEKAADTQRELMTRYQESRKKGVESRHKTEMRHKIKDVVSELNQYLLRGNKDRHVPIELQKAVAEALDAVNMDTVGAAERIAKLNEEMMRAKTPEKVQEISRKIDHIKEMGDRMDNKLKALKAAYDKFTDSDDPLIANSYDEVISSKIQSVIESVGNTPLRDMTLTQLEDVYDMYRMVLTTVRNANKAFKAAKSESIAVLGNRVMMEVDNLGKKKAWRTKAGDSVSKFAWNSYKPVFAFERIGSKTLSRIYESVRAGEDVWATDVTEAKEFYREQSKKYKYDSWDFGKRYDFRSTSGKEFSLSLEQIMSLYAYSKREQAAEHLKRGGIVFDESTEVTMKTKLGIKVKFNPMEATAYNLSDQTLAAIISKLTPEQKAFVDVMQDYLSTTMGAKGNEVSLELYGIKLFKEKHYFPLKSAPQFMAIAKEQQQGTAKIKNSGFSKETVQKASNPIVLTPFMNVWSNHVNEMSMYHAFVLPMEDFYRVYNYKTPTSDTMATESVEMFIQNAYGKGATQYIDQLLKDLNGGARTDPRAGVMTTLIGKFKKSAVFASASVVVQQPSAIARALSLLDAKYFVGKMTLRKHSEAWAEVKKYAPVAIIKEMGYFDTNMGMQTTEWMTTKEYSGFSEKLKALFTDSNFRDEMLSKAPALADELSWCYIWEAVKRETRATTKLQPGTEEFLAKAGERFTEVITKTQVYDSVLARSGMMRSKDTGLKMATAFMAEPTTSLNMIADAIVQGKRGNKAYAAKTIGAVAASMILNSILVSFVYAGRDDDEDKTYAEKYVGTLTEELLDSFNPLTLIPFVKDVVSIFQGYDVERSDMAVVTDLVKAWNNLSNDNRTVYRKVEDFAGAIASIFGLPVKNIMRDARAMYNTVNSFLSGEQTTGAGIKNAVTEAVTGKEMSKSEKLFDAMESGDSAMLDRIESQYKDQDAFEIAVRQALRGEYEEGDLSDSQAVDMLVDYGGKAEDEAIAMVMYWAFKQDNPDIYVDDSWISEYYADGVAEAGISIETFVEYRNQVKDITGEGKKERRMAVIHSMPITNTQKDALYLAEGWTESRLYEAPWH